MQNKISRLIMTIFISMASLGNYDFCEERTTEAYHSPQCGHIWTVRDPHRVDDLRIPHDPPYHTYSRWKINKDIYILAYRDIDYDPSDMAVDIYMANEQHYTRIGEVGIGGYIINVFTAKLTSMALEDIVFRYDSGQLQYISVVKFICGRAEEVFYYGASVIEVDNKTKSMIIAKLKIANKIQHYLWDHAANEFILVKESPWRK